MTSAGDLNKSDGDVFYSADVTALLNSQAKIFNDTAQTIFALDYIGFDNKLNGYGIPNLKNVEYDTFTSDNAISNTNFTYDTTNDRYNLNSSTGNIVVGLNFDIGENVTSIIPIVNDLFITSPISTTISNSGFESGVTDWDIVYTDSQMSSGISTSEFQEGSQSLYFRHTFLSSGSVIGNVKREQTDIDFSGTTAISFYLKRNSETNGNFFLNVYNGNKIVRAISKAEISSSSWTKFFVKINTCSTLGFEQQMTSTANGGGTVDVYIDNIEQYNDDSVLTFSNDGSTYESCENGKIFRPSTTGQKILLKISAPSGATTDSFISEYAVKYNLY